MAYTVFISATQTDAEAARDVARRFQDAGLRTWHSGDLKPGEAISRVIDRVLRECNEVVVLLSPSAVQNPSVMVEIGMALSLHKPVVPILIDLTPADVPEVIRGLQSVTYAELPRHIASVSGRYGMGKELAGSGHGWVWGDVASIERQLRKRLSKKHRASRADAEEAIQRTFIRALADPSSIPGGAEARSWFETAVDREYWRLARAGRREEARTEPLSEVALAGTVQDALASLISQEDNAKRAGLLKAIEDAIASLPQRHRQVIERSYLGNETTIQIAADLGMSQATIRQMKYRALRSLQRSLRESLASAESSPGSRPSRP